MADEAHMPEAPVMPLEELPEPEVLNMEVMPLVDDLALAASRLRALQAKAFILRCKADLMTMRREEEQRRREEEQAARQPRRWWTRPWLINRPSVGQYISS